MEGIILKDGNTIPVKEKNKNKIFVGGNCAVFIDKHSRRIFLWKGANSSMKDRFSAAHLAENLDKKVFGGSGKIIQNNSEIQNTITPNELENIPEKILRSAGI